MRLVHAALIHDHFACIDREDHGRYHLITAPDGPNPHDHAQWGFWTTIKFGGYLEEIWTPGLRLPYYVERKPGDTFRVEAHTIHRIHTLREDCCLTHVGPDHHTGTPHAFMYDWRDDAIYRRPVFGGEWEFFARYEV